MRHFCTYFDSRYLPQAMAMLESLARVEPGFACNVWALDIAAVRAVSRYQSDVCPTASLYFSVTYDSAHRAPEDIWRLTPRIVWDSLEMFPEVAYIDADLWFTGNLDPLYAECAGAPAAVIPHRWDAEHAARLSVNGQYNVGWTWFNGDGGRRIASDWLEWCADWTPTPEQPRFLDQLHLDGWPARGAHVVAHRGANVAPYNQRAHDWATAMLFYHFHEFRWVLAPDGCVQVRRTGYPLAREIVRRVYEPYEARIAAWARRLASDGFIDGGPTPC